LPDLLFGDTVKIIQSPGLPGDFFTCTICNFRKLETKQRYTFKKDEKLKSRKAIELLFKEGNSFSNFPFRILWMFNEVVKAPLQTGFAVSSKHFKKAVDRNRVKRLMREAYRLQKNELQNQLQQQQKQLAVFIIYVGNELPEYAFVFDKMDHVLKRLIKLTNENLTANT
jgi:ribonuclease P protein component